jgi:hypothetical protein
MDTHSLVDVGTLVFAVASAWLASRRDLLTRIAEIETEVAEIRGLLKGAGVWDGTDRRRRIS